MRYALYLMPEPSTPLWRAASELIGYDAARGSLLAQPTLEGFSASALAKATEDPRRYGFHLTLKAPFRLAAGQNESQLRDATERFCAERAPFEIGALRLEARIGAQGTGFICLVPEGFCPALFSLEATCVRDFDGFRAPLNAEDISRRRPALLSARQRAHLEALGYPFVLDEFRPHFSLTGTVDKPEAWLKSVEAYFAQQETRLESTITGIGLFKQENASERFRLMTFARFSGTPN